VLRNDIVKHVTKVECYCDRLMFVKISIKLVDIVIVQINMLTMDHDDDEIEKMYNEISEIMYQNGRGQVNAIMMGDFNSIVGEGSTNKVVGLFGFSKSNERGKMLINFCRQHDLVVINTWFTILKTKRYT
jgi:hypothetical protein